MKGGKRPGAGRPRTAPHVEGWGGCRCRDCHALRELGKAVGEVDPTAVIPQAMVLIKGENDPAPLRVVPKREKAQVKFGHVEREDVVKDVPWEPGDTGGA